MLDYFNETVIYTHFIGTECKGHCNPAPSSCGTLSKLALNILKLFIALGAFDFQNHCLSLILTGQHFAEITSTEFCRSYTVGNSRVRVVGLVFDTE